MLLLLLALFCRDLICFILIVAYRMLTIYEEYMPKG